MCCFLMNNMLALMVLKHQELLESWYDSGVAISEAGSTYDQEFLALANSRRL